MIRRMGESVQRDQTYTYRPGAYAILERHGQLLLTFQNEPVPEFQLPGGGIDVGEQVLPALHREIFEETGWRVTGLRRLGAFRRFTYMPEYDLWAEKLCSVYFGTPTVRISDPVEDGHTAVWFDPSSALDVIANDGDRAFLSRLYG